MLLLLEVVSNMNPEAWVDHSSSLMEFEDMYLSSSCFALTSTVASSRTLCRFPVIIWVCCVKPCNGSETFCPHQISSRSWLYKLLTSPCHLRFCIDIGEPKAVTFDVVASGEPGRDSRDVSMWRVLKLECVSYLPGRRCPWGSRCCHCCEVPSVSCGSSTVFTSCLLRGESTIEGAFCGPMVCVRSLIGWRVDRTAEIGIKDSQ